MTTAALQKNWFGHPRGLTILFLTDTWTMFSFYGMRALLVYYMTKQLMFSQAHSSLVYGLYGSFAYFTPLIGGALSDRWLGRKRAVILGGAIMAAGHFMMAFPALLYPALATIAAGNGLFLPSLPSQINLLYAEDDPRRSSAYNVYYVGVNFGAFLSPFLCGTVGELYGWHWGFTLAGVGMVIGLLIYIFGQGYLPADVRRELTVETVKPQPFPVHLYILLAIITSTVVLFRAAYEQAGNTVALWADAGVDRVVPHLGTIPMTWFQSLNPLLIFLLTPFVVAYWTKRARRGLEPSDVHKMSMGAFITGGSYILLAAVAYWAGVSGAAANWLWLVVFFIVYTLGELLVLPVGLGLFGRLAPAAFAATTIAAWFLGSFAGNFGAGLLGVLWGPLSPAAFFALTGGVCAVAGSLLFGISQTRAWRNEAEKHRAAVTAMHQAH